MGKSIATGARMTGSGQGAGKSWGMLDVALLAVGAGCLIGLGESAAVAWRYFIRDAVTHITPHVAWMAPLGYSVLLLALGALPAMHPAGRRDPRPALFIFAGIGLASWVAMMPWSLHPLAVAALAAGAGYQISRFAGRRPIVLARALRRVVPVLVMLVAVASASVLGWRVYTDRQASEMTGPAEPGRPNVLLLILDTVRARSMGLYGGRPGSTPEIDAFAASAVVFEQAQSTAPWTLPSHASMFTGRWPHELSVGWSSPLDGAEPTLAEVLSSYGYATAGFVANLSYGARAYGLSRGFAHYEDFPLTPGQVVLATSLGRHLASWDALRSLVGDHELLNRKTAADIRNALVSWLDTRPDRPFFVFANLFDAHEPYEPPPDIREVYAPGYRREGVEHRHNLLRGVNARRLEKWATSTADSAGELALYEATIASIDRELGRLLRELEERGLLQNTVVILTSDHGEQFGEHGLWDHMQSLYQPLVHVPLIVRPPGGLPESVRIARPVSLRDLPVTVLDLIDAEGDTGTPFPGTSLAPLWRAADPDTILVSPAVSELERGLVEQPWYPIAAGLEMQSLLNGTIFYICNPDASEELYDLSTDPDESENLAGTPFGDEAIRAFRRAIAHVGAPPRWCPPPPDQQPRRPNRPR